METLQELGDAMDAKSDATLVTLVVDALCDHTEPPEPGFLTPYRLGYHEPPLGTLTMKLKHLYLVYVKVTVELLCVPESSLLARRHGLIRQLFCQEVRAHFKMEMADDREFEVCKGFRLCLVAEETSDAVGVFVPYQASFQFTTDMMPQ